MKIRKIVIAVLSGLFVIILLQNTQVAELRILFWKVSMSRIILFPLTLLFGVLLGFVLGRYKKKAQAEISEVE